MRPSRFALLLAATLPASAAALPADLAGELRLAAHDEAALRTALLAAIARQPQAAEAILAEAIALAPESRAALTDAAAAAFPVFAPRFAALAGPAAVERRTPWAGELSLGGGRTSGNTETAEAGVGAKIAYRGAAWEHDFSLSFDYGRESEETTRQRLLTDLDSRLDLNRRLYGFAFLQFENDRFSGFSFEATQSVGLGYRVALPPPVAWRVQAGPGARQARVRATGDTESELVALIRSDLDWPFSETGRLGNTTTVTVGAERTVTRNLSTLTMQLIGELAARFSFEVEHDSEPAPGAEAVDTIAKASLVYAF